MHRYHQEQEAASLRSSALLSLSANFNSTEDHHDEHVVDSSKQPHSMFPLRGRSRQSSLQSERSCESMSDDEMRDLWRCMLELQERFGCYKSARIDMALSAGDVRGDLMPNRFIIDTLNDSIVELPDEGWELLSSHLNSAPISH